MHLKYENKLCAEMFDWLCIYKNIWTKKILNINIFLFAL